MERKSKDTNQHALIERERKEKERAGLHARNNNNQAIPAIPCPSPFFCVILLCAGVATNQERERYPKVTNIFPVLFV